MGILDLIVSPAITAIDRIINKDKYEKWESEQVEIAAKCEAYRHHIEAGGESIVVGTKNRYLVNSFLKKKILEIVEGDLENGYRVNSRALEEKNIRTRAELLNIASREAAEREEKARRRKEQEERERIRKKEEDRLFAEANYYCDSPPEISFLKAAIAEFNLEAKSMAFLGPGIELRNQVEIGPYRVDFLFNKKVIVEIDGYEFHSGQDAVDRDAKRDVFLRGKGYRVLRIPAYRVFHNARATISDVRDMLGV